MLSAANEIPHGGIPSRTALLLLGQAISRCTPLPAQCALFSWMHVLEAGIMCLHGILVNG